MKFLLGIIIIIIIGTVIYRKKHKPQRISSKNDQSISTITLDEIASDVSRAVGHSFSVNTFFAEGEIEISSVFPYEGYVMVYYKVTKGNLEDGESILKAAEKEIRERAKGHQGKYLVRTRCIEFNGEKL